MFKLTFFPFAWNFHGIHISITGNSLLMNILVTALQRSSCNKPSAYTLQETRVNIGLINGWHNLWQRTAWHIRRLCRLACREWPTAMVLYIVAFARHRIPTQVDVDAESSPGHTHTLTQSQQHEMWVKSQYIQRRYGTFRFAVTSFYSLICA